MEDGLPAGRRTVSAEVVFPEPEPRDVSAVLTVLATGAAAGQPRGVVADIPFAFHVGDVELPAGSHTFSADTWGGKLLLVRGEGKGVYRIVQHQGSYRHSRFEAVFHEYPDGSHFLEEIWVLGQAGRQVVKSKLEAKVSTDWRLKRIAVALRPAGGPGSANGSR